MKMRTKIPEKERAAARTTAPIIEQHNGSYRKPAPLSKTNLKENLGLLLYHLQSPLTKKQRRMSWQLFEVVLRQYYDVKTSGGLDNE